MKIVINKNILANYEDSNIYVMDSNIVFKKDGEYTLEYIDSEFISLNIEVLDEVKVKLFIISCDNKLNVDNSYKLGKNSNLTLFKFYYNKLVNEKVVIDLNGENAMVNYNFSSISKENEEYHIIVNHNHHRVNSKISNKCIGLNDSKINLVIDSILDKGNVACVMDQYSRILTLGDVEASIVPNMFIDEDSVEARHASVIGNIRMEDIFY